MRLLIDVNVLLDVLLPRPAHFRDSALLWTLCEIGRAEGYVSALTFANIIYVMRKELNPEKIDDLQEDLALVFRFAALEEADLAKAARMRWNDFEDAVQHATAARIQADCIITRNVRDFGKSEIPALTPTEYLTRM